MGGKLIPLFLFLPCLLLPADSVAVIDFVAKGGVPKEDASMLSDFFRSDLVRMGAYDVVDRKNMDAVLKELEFSQSGCTDAECAVKIGQLLNVGYIFVGTVSIFARKFVLAADKIRVETGKIEDSARETADKLEDLLEVVKVLAARFSGSAVAAGKPDSAPAAAEAAKPQADKPAAESRPAAREPGDVKLRISQSILQGTFRKDPDWIQVAELSSLLSLVDRQVLYNKYEKGWTFFWCAANLVGVGSWIQGDILGAIILDVGIVGSYMLGAFAVGGYAFIPLLSFELYGLINPWIYAWGYNEDLKRALSIPKTSQGPPPDTDPSARTAGLRINIVTLRF